ncbi:MAG: glycosyltransferase family 2 protein [Chromatiales bacterium]|jgi:glycosyltransferase involved in cell wall biosynthesis|nr:glycosyltransferase family 2 protein [Chromatiales bacterium]
MSQEAGGESVAAGVARAPEIAILIPCYNEEAAIAAVVADFKAALPGAKVYVYDNNSADRTRSVAADAGAIVRSETRQGKGYVVRRMFADVDADVYLLVDGDATYDAACAPALIRQLLDGPLDMVNGARVSREDVKHRPGHQFGNRLLSGLVAWIFGNRFRDMLSGYKVFSRRFVKSFPALSAGFEIETELTVHALELAMPVTEVDTPYSDRAEGTESKLNTFRDGYRILKTIGIFIKEERPLQFFSAVAGVFALGAVILGLPVIVTYLQTGLVPRLPTAVLSTGLILLGALSLTAGLILDTVTRGRREAKRMRYLSIAAAPGAGVDD